MTEVYFIA